MTCFHTCDLAVPTYVNKVVSVATITPPAELAGLGEVRLDAFIVSSNTSLPGDGHWESTAVGAAMAKRLGKTQD
jgi:hypothetical protein